MKGKLEPVVTALKAIDKYLRKKSLEMPVDCKDFSELVNIRKQTIEAIKSIEKNVMEIWKDIKGYEGYYQISNHGMIKSLSRKCKNKYGFILNKEKFLKIFHNGDGYPIVTLCKPSRGQKILSIHRLIAIHFIDNPKQKKEVNHLNGIKSDNRIENLEWCSHKENMEHANKTDLFDNYRNIQKS